MKDADVARQQTLVQPTDDLLGRLDERAAREGISRSQLIRDALEVYSRRTGAARSTRRSSTVTAASRRSELDDWVAAMAEQSLRATEPW